MYYAHTLSLKEVQVELTSMSPVFPDDRLTVKRVMEMLYRNAKSGIVRYSFINQLRRELKRIGFNV